MSELLNDLNISLTSAVKALSEAGMGNKDKAYSLNSSLSTDEALILTTYARNNRRKLSKAKGKNQNNKTGEKSKKVKSSDSFTRLKSFNSCYSFYFNNIREKESFAPIQEKMVKVFGEELKPSTLQLFRSGKIAKNFNVTYTYYYYSLRGHKSLVQVQCFATWLASLFSEAVNKGLITKIDYHLFFKEHLYNYIEAVKPKRKKKPISPKHKRPWVSIVSVPFGGMNRR